MQSALINNGCDLHLHYGPIDLIVSVKGLQVAVKKAHHVAIERFRFILPELVEELTLLRQPLSAECQFSGTVAKRMVAAAMRFDGTFMTPMISVAGAVADEMLAEILKHVDGLESISINNGGDIALWHAAGKSSIVGVADLVSGVIVSRAKVSSSDRIGGIASSGRHGRSMSIGIADSVSVMADDAATADAAATLIANAVDLSGSLKVHRQAADIIDPDTDLGARLVTVDVEQLSRSECLQALHAGFDLAKKFKQQNKISAAYILLQGHWLATEYYLRFSKNKSIQPTIVNEVANA